MWRSQMAPDSWLLGTFMAELFFGAAAAKPRVETSSSTASHEASRFKPACEVSRFKPAIAVVDAASANVLGWHGICKR